MTARELLYDSETLLRLVDDEIKELRDETAAGDDPAAPAPPLPAQDDVAPAVPRHVQIGL